MPRVNLALLKKSNRVSAVSSLRAVCFFAELYWESLQHGAMHRTPPPSDISSPRTKVVVLLLLSASSLLQGAAPEALYWPAVVLGLLDNPYVNQTPGQRFTRGVSTN